MRRTLPLAAITVKHSLPEPLMASIFVLKAPLKVFVQKNVREKDLALFSELSREPRPTLRE
jgi:flagellar biosynthesis protein FliP